jgi:hypothetical protein
MSVGAVIAVLVAVEAVLVVAAVRWLVSGLRNTELVEGPAIMPIGPAQPVPDARGSGRRADDTLTAAS